jgi:hypothetical protein
MQAQARYITCEKSTLNQMDTKDVQNYNQSKCYLKLILYFDKEISPLDLNTMSASESALNVTKIFQTINNNLLENMFL